MSSLKSEGEKKKELARDNAINIILYAMAFTVAMGVNDVMTTAFSEREKRKHVLGKIIYVAIILAIAILFAYLFRGKFQTY